MSVTQFVGECHHSSTRVLLKTGKRVQGELALAAMKAAAKAAAQIGSSSPQVNPLL